MIGRWWVCLDNRVDSKKSSVKVTVWLTSSENLKFLITRHLMKYWTIMMIQAKKWSDTNYVVVKERGEGMDGYWSNQSEDVLCRCTNCHLKGIPDYLLQQHKVFPINLVFKFIEPKLKKKKNCHPCSVTHTCSLQENKRLEFSEIVLGTWHCIVSAY